MEQENPQSASILVIDHDVRLCQLIAEFFQDTGYAIHAVHDGPTGLARAVSISSCWT